MPLAHEMHIIFCTAYDLEQKAAHLGLLKKIPHFLNGHAQIEFYNTVTLPSQLVAFFFDAWPGLTSPDSFQVVF